MKGTEDNRVNKLASQDGQCRTRPSWSAQQQTTTPRPAPGPPGLLHGRPLLRSTHKHTTLVILKLYSTTHHRLTTEITLNFVKLH